MSIAGLHRWDGEALVPIDYCDPRDYRVEVVDSFLIRDGAAFALELHWDRFQSSVESRGSGFDGFEGLDVSGFWAAALSLVPDRGEWFPRFELQSLAGSAQLLFRHRAAPELSRSAVLATLDRPDPRRVPGTKGPDVDALLSARTAARHAGADDAVILTRDGFIIDATTSAIVWWRGDILCAPPEARDAPEFERVASVTARSLFGLADVLGVETHRERATPAELAGAEVWVLSALHGIRIVTRWIGGPSVAELPGRLALWRDRLEALRKPIGVAAP